MKTHIESAAELRLSPLGRRVMRQLGRAAALAGILLLTSSGEDMVRSLYGLILLAIALPLTLCGGIR